MRVRKRRVKGNLLQLAALKANRSWSELGEELVAVTIAIIKRKTVIEERERENIIEWYNLKGS